MKLSIFFLMCALIVPCIPAVAAAEGAPGLINSLNGNVEYSEYSNTTSKEEEPLMLLIHKAGYKGGKLYIAHVFNPNFANIIKINIKNKLNN